MIRIVCTADNHLGRYYAKMSRDQLSERRRRIRAAWRQTVEFAIKNRVNFYLHCGDLFDRPDPSPSELAYVARELKRLQDNGIQMLAISGNHDMHHYTSESEPPVRIYDELRAARVFTKTKDIEFEVFEIDGTKIAIGGIAPDPGLTPNSDPLDGVTYTAPRADVTLLLLHCGFEDRVPPNFGDAILPKSRVAAMKGIDYFFLGDIHRTHKAVVDDATVVIPGTTERMTFGELKEKPGFYYVELDGKSALKLLHQKIDTQPMRREIIRTTDLPGEKPTEFVFKQLREWSDKEQLMQLRIEGPLPREVYHRLHFFDIWRLGNELNFFFDLDRAAITLEREETNGAGGEIVSARREIERVAEELAAQRDGDERVLIEEARELVMQRLGREE